jgi:cysteinyl-tRNA synthetase
VRDLLDKGVPGEVIRFVFLSTHYRKPMDWTEEKAREAARTLRKWRQLIAGADGQTSTEAAPEVVETMSDDLNTAGAIAILHKIASKNDGAQLRANCALLGLLTDELAGWESRPGVSLDALEEKLTKVRERAMQTKDFTELDRMKSILVDAGVSVQMGKVAIGLAAGPEVDIAKLEALL